MSLAPFAGEQLTYRTVHTGAGKENIVSFDWEDNAAKRRCSSQGEVSAGAENGERGYLFAKHKNGVKARLATLADLKRFLVKREGFAPDARVCDVAAEGAHDGNNLTGVSAAGDVAANAGDDRDNKSSSSQSKGTKTKRGGSLDLTWRQHRSSTGMIQPVNPADETSHRPGSSGLLQMNRNRRSIDEIRRDNTHIASAFFSPSAPAEVDGNAATARGE